MHNRDMRFKRLALVLMLLVTLSCDAVASLMPGGRTPTAEPPPLTSTPVPEDLPPLPAPELLFRAPEVNELQALNGPVELVFDQPMDQESVADAFSIKPRAKGELVWADARTLRFNPASALDRGTTYQVTIDETARNIEGAALVEAISFDFNTIGFVEIAEVQPMPGSEAVEADATVTVIFNRPIVPLTSLDRQGELPEGGGLPARYYVYGPRYIRSDGYPGRCAGRSLPLGFHHCGTCCGDVVTGRQRGVCRPDRCHQCHLQPADGPRLDGGCLQTGAQ